MNTPTTSRGKARGRSVNPAGLRPGNQSREVGIFTDRGFRMQSPFGGAFDATLLLFQLLLFAGLFSAALFQRRPSGLAHIIGPVLCPSGQAQAVESALERPAMTARCPLCSL